jgi:hypothetical protein
MKGGKSQSGKKERFGIIPPHGGDDTAQRRFVKAKM